MAPESIVLDTTETERHWRDLPEEPTARRRLRWWRELLLVFVLYEVYSLVRNTFGSSGSSIGSKVSPDAVAIALGHAHDVINIEKHLGLFFEPRLQEWYLGLPGHGLIKFWNIYYGSFHFIIPIVVLIWLFRRFPRDYTVWRNALVLTTIVALVGFASFSLMPPRLLDHTGQFGGCSLPASIVAANPQLACHQFGFIDTLESFGGLWSFGSTAMAQVSNQFAAMPSLHIGWSTWCAIVVAPRARRRWVKGLVILYPFATLFCILITANHYWLDAVGGLVTLGVGTVLGWQLALATHRWADRRDAKRLVSPAATSAAAGVPHHGDADAPA
ncbi:MAG TPA: phosphatase PAP2 family protein [Acidimicrobiales bacterium]|nr:phosphatase PAP2 family protein [Acidimicrobiales bacterium]